MYLKINDDFHSVYKSELRNQTFQVSLQHHQTKEKKFITAPLTSIHWKYFHHQFLFVRAIPFDVFRNADNGI